MSVACARVFMCVPTCICKNERVGPESLILTYTENAILCKRKSYVKLSFPWKFADITSKNLIVCFAL